MPNKGTPPGRMKLQAWMPPELLAQLDAVGLAAGRLSRRQVLEEGWDAMLDAACKRYGVERPR